MLNQRACLLGCCLIILNASIANATKADDLTSKAVLNMSLEELGNIEITSVSKKAEKATEAAAAIYVITQEDIRRSGMTSIPELLRMAPGLNVAQAASHQWAVSARGFNDQFANKLLVLIDGRTIYTPVFSGVIWDVQDVPLGDIDRIEVIRGPGATLWGANAVNGIINIITKNAADTQGSYVTAGYGNQENFQTAGYGGKLAENGHWRAYLKNNVRDGLENASTGLNAGDSWRKSQAGFRADSTLNNSDNLTVQGDIYYSRESFLFNLPDFTVGAGVVPTHDNGTQRGANLLARWGHKLSDISDLTLQTYYDFAGRNIAYYMDNIHAFDVDFQHEWRGFDRQEIIWGAGYRLVSMNSEDTTHQIFRPKDRNDNLFSAFLQDEIAIVPDEFYLTLGSKFEHNDYTGFEFQPSARFAWLIDDDRTLWGSIARAVHTPYRFIEDSRLRISAYPGPPTPGFIETQGIQTLYSEELIAYELGYRFKPIERASVDLAAFYNDYDKIRHGSFGVPVAAVDSVFGAYTSLPVLSSKNNGAKSYGFEAATNVDLATNWQLAGSYSYINLKYDMADPTASIIGKNPRHQFNVRSTYLLPYNIEMTNALYYVDDLKGIAIPDYYRFDTRLAWQPLDGVELSLVGQNLLDTNHPEFSAFLYQNAEEVGRTVYASAIFRF